LTFLALLIFYDPPKQGVVEALAELRKLGIRLKVISGDNKHVVTSVTRSVLGYEPQVLTGSELFQSSNEVLRLR
jgi:Mg2+-importing ATPase